MAIEIKELVIRMEVGKTQSSIKREEGGKLTEAARKQIVQECIEKVLRKLESKGDR